MGKRMIIIVLCLLFLTGCSNVFPNEYLSVEEHEAPFAYRETTVAPTETETESGPEPAVAFRDSDIRQIIQGFVLEGTEWGQILLRDYQGDPQEDMKNMFSFMLNNAPKYNYAMDSFKWEMEDTPEGPLVTVEMQLRLTPQEIRAIPTRLWPSSAQSLMYQALTERLSSFTLQVSGYQETDLVALLEEYILQHPDQVIEAPEISAAVYPERGDVRVVELHFVYDYDLGTLSAHAEQTSSMLNLISRQLSPEQNAQDQIDTLYMHLVPSFGYSEMQNASVYSQVVRKSGSARTMASVAAYLCRLAGAECQIVRGQKGTDPWYWNRILSENRWLYFDLHSAALEGTPPALMPASEWTAYSWDPDLYPEIEQEPSPEPDTSEPTEHADSGEDLNGTEPTEEP